LAILLNGLGERNQARVSGAIIGQGSVAARALVANNKAIELKPDSVSSYVGPATAKARKSDFDGAIADFTKAINCAKATEFNPNLSKSLSESRTLKTR